MKYKILISIMSIILIITLMMSNVKSDYIYWGCPQENANETTVGDDTSAHCALNYTGSYYNLGGTWGLNVNLIYDKNWSSYAYSSGPATSAAIDVNYTKPNTADILGAFWTVKDFLGTASYYIPPSCWSYSSKSLAFHVVAPSSTNNAQWYCRNSTGDQLLRGNAPSGYREIYEESITWISGSYFDFIEPTNPTCTFLNGVMTSDHIYIPTISFNSSTTDTISCTSDGYYPFNLTFNISEGGKSIRMSKKELVINFLNNSGSLNYSNGYWTDGLRTQSFYSNNLSLNMLNLSIGTVKVYFGNNLSLFNFTQFYEFINDGTISSIENMTLLGNNLNRVYIKVVDESSDPIDNALVRLSFSNPSTGGTYKEMGQRLSGSELVQGQTYFYVPSDSDITIRVSKDGYDTVNQTRNIIDGSYTSSNPISIGLKRGINNVYKSLILRICEYYNNNTANIPLSIYAPTRGNIKFSTSFVPSTNWTINLNIYKVGTFNGLTGLIKGTHYCSNCTDDLNITLYVDEEYFNTYTIKYRQLDQSKLTTPTGLNNDFTYKLIWIALILGVGILGFAFKSTEEGTGTGSRGKVLFMIGCLVIPLIFAGSFVFLLIITVFYGLGTLLRRWIAE